MKTTNFTKRFALMGLGILALCVTIQAQPANFQQHGDNSSGTTVASENIDSVTVGGTIGYFVMPDLTINQDGDGPYDYATNADALISTFDWWTSSSDVPVDNGAENVVDITWSSISGVNADTIYVTELGASCNASDTTQIPVRVINAPEIEFSSATGSRCVGGTDGSLSEDLTNIGLGLTTDVISGNRQLVITYNVACSNVGFSTITGATDNLAEDGTGFDITGLTHFGTYTITITAINDRISTKSGINGATGDVDSDLTTQSTYAFTISAIPNTGVIYHLPNQ